MTQNASLSAYSTIYAFGDSLSDAGDLSIATSALSVVSGAATPAAPYYQEQYGQTSARVFSNGPTWVQDLSVALGLGTLAPSLLGGTDFAYGGAETGSTPQNGGNTELMAISLPSQLAQFQAAVTSPSANALYTVSIGSNDLLEILGQSGISAQQQATDVTDAVNNEIAFLSALVAGGAKNLLVLNVPDLGKTPDVTQGLVNGSNVPSAALDAEASQLSSTYDTELASRLATLAATAQVRVTIADAYQLIDTTVAYPATAGLTNVTSSVWSGTYSDPNSGTLATTNVAAQNQYLFWDRLHPTETAQLAVAALAQTGLIAAATNNVYGGDTSDILWSNASSGQVVEWEMSQGAPISGATLLNDPAWSVIGTGDFNGDHTADILWRNAATGTVVDWQMSGGAVSATATLLTDPAWTVVATGDFNGDGRSDILWGNPTTGAVSEWDMNGAALITAGTLLIDRNWSVAGVGDFTGNGTDDILWRNATTGAVVEWEMNNGAPSGAFPLLTDPAWTVAGIGDFSGTGTDDILWRNAATGTVVEWQMTNGSPTAATTLLQDPNWTVSGVGDYNGDGKSDILWRNAGTGETVAWLMNGSSHTTASLIANTAWTPIASLLTSA